MLIMSHPPPLLCTHNHTPPQKKTLGGPAWKYFSGACWFYGRHLAEVRPPILPLPPASTRLESSTAALPPYHNPANPPQNKTQKQGLGVPVGLIQAAYGSTELKAWSPPEALAACPPTPDAWAPTPVDDLPPEAQQVPPEVAAGTGGGGGTPTPPAADEPTPTPPPPPPPPVVTTPPPLPPVQQRPPPTDAPAVPAVVPTPPATPVPAVPTTTPAAVAPTAGGGAGNLRRRRRAQTFAAAGVTAPAPVGMEPPPAVAVGAEPTAAAPAPALEPKWPGKPRAWQTDWHPEPATCFNAMAHPLRLMALRGVVWDQGEQDVHHAAEDYECLLPEFIKGWRRAFPYANALGPMPFGVFQLQGYASVGWCWLNCCGVIGRTGMVVCAVAPPPTHTPHLHPHIHAL